MKIRNIISICLLTVYAIVMAHNFIPHHHHSENTQHCELEQPEKHCCEHSNHAEQFVQETNSCSVNHHHENHSHTFCSFEEKIVLTKFISLSNLFLPSSEIEYFELPQNKKSFTDSYISIPFQDPQCRDVLLRGPPQFS